MVRKPLKSDAWESRKKIRIRQNLEALSLDGLGVTSINVDYFIRHYATLNGKDYRILSQIGSFVFRPLVAEGMMTIEEWKVWEAIGDVGRLLFRSRIGPEAVESHLEDTKRALQSLAAAMAPFHPETIVTKVKWHKLLAHTVEQIRRFGPLSGVSSEIFESFHTITRNHSIHSNRQAPSRDIGRTFATQEALRHVVRGGYWQQDGRWDRAGLAVRSFIEGNAAISKLLGVAPTHSPTPGKLKSAPPTFHLGKRTWTNSFLQVNPFWMRSGAFLKTFAGSWGTVGQ